MPDLQNIKRNSNDFSFTDTAASLVNNKEYRSGYQDLIDGKHNDKTYFWEALSAVGDELGETLYENVLNYVNNAANINTCKLRALTSIAKVLGVTEFAILKNLNTVPPEILNLMDIFSINKAYLLNINNFNTDFVKDLISECLNEETLSGSQERISSDLSNFFLASSFPSADIENATSSINVFGAMSQRSYEKFVEDAFFKLLCSKLFQTYGDKENPYQKNSESNSLVYHNLTTMYDVEDLNFFSLASLRYKNTDKNDPSKQGTRDSRVLNSYYSGNLAEDDSEDTVSADINYFNKVSRYKYAFNVRSDFNESKIVDAIEMGEDFIDNYSGPELSVLMLEISERSKRMYSPKGYATDPTTRYAYYKEREVLNYYRFINDTIMLYNTNSIVEKNDIENPVSIWSVYTLSNFFNPYHLNTNYSEITLSDNYTLSDSISYCERIVSADSRFDEFSAFIFDYYSQPDLYKTDEELSAGTTYSANAVKMTAYILKEICMAIVNLRETLKTQAQRNYMTGTKLLMEYVLNEYVSNFLVNNYGISRDKVNYGLQDDDENAFGIVVQEYNDCTEYFNIGSSEHGSGKTNYSINSPYFYDLKDDPNTGTTVDANGLAIFPENDPAESIKSFYLSTLNIESEFIKASDYYDFMSAVYEVGISKTLIGKNGKLVIDRTDLTDLLDFSLDFEKIKKEHNLTDEDLDLFKSTYLVSSQDGYLSVSNIAIEPYLDVVSSEVERLSTDVEIYNARLSSRLDSQRKIVLSYGGRDFDYYPWYNYKNQDFPTFQSHPYLYNFIEHNNERYPIENAFYGSTNEEYLEEIQSKAISVYLEEYGNLRRIWRSGVLDFSGYKSKYEYYSHTAGPSNSNLLYSVQHYDGTFYPPAIELYHKYFYGEITEIRNGHLLSGLELLSVHMLEGVRNYNPGKRKDIPNISSMWDYYSQLYLSENETQHIVDQLLGLSADIMRMSSYKYRSENRLKKDPYDIFKYGLDYDDNSLILLKQYSKSDPSFSEKINTPGELWIRFNAHPIGFPAFKLGSNLQQFNLEKPESMEKSKLKVNGLLRSYAKNNEIKIYDFGLTKSRKQLVFAIPNPTQTYKEYKDALNIPVVLYDTEIVEDKNLGKRKLYFPLENITTFLFPGKGTPPDSLHIAELSGIESYISDSDGYEFDGYLQANSELYLGFVKKNTFDDLYTLSSVQFNIIKYPGKNQFIFKEDNFITNFGNIEAYPTIDSAYKLGYIGKEFREDGTFTLAINAKIPEDRKIEIQNFVGNNTVTSNIEPEIRGKTELIDATSGNTDIANEYNSFDRFSDYILMYDVNESNLRYKKLEDSLKLNIFGLNSDASYVPQYYGLSGQNLFYLMKDSNGEKISYNKDWYNDDLVPIQSLELLGYTFQALHDKIKDKEDSLHLDEETGKLTDFDKDALLKNALRVYEDYYLSQYVFQTYNDSQRYTTNLSSELTSFTSIFPLKIDGLSEDTLSNFNVLLLNSSGGKNRNPIIAGVLSYEIVNNPLYDKEASEEEESILSIGYGLEKRLRVVGTPNPFVLSTGTFAYDYSNHIFGIAGLETELLSDYNGEYAISVNFVISEKAKHINFVLQSGTLQLFVYRNTMEEFEKYHYMEPFNNYPYNAALSSWLVPWKDKDHGYLYLNDYLTSDQWGRISSYMVDIRRTARDNTLSIFDELCAGPGISSYHVVGHLPHSAYNENNELCIDPSDGRLIALSLMENINLSSLASFNDCYYLSTGQITWKISEEDIFDYLKNFYPPRVIDNVLYKLYGNTNRSAVKFNIFDLSNTYIFQLEDPERIAERIATVAVPVGSPSEQCDFVYEDYLSDAINTNTDGKEMASYYETLYDPIYPTEAIKYTYDKYAVSSDIATLNSIISSEEINSLDLALSVMDLSGFHVEDSEYTSNVNILDYQELSVTAEEISEYLKLYVNWRVYENENNAAQKEIELFFNLPNLFMSPYSYRTKEGTYSTEYKKNTYLRLKSGEDGYLYVIFQFKYYDMTGNLRGVRDLPILTYHIFNVSDDKPKFVITKTFEIDNRDGKYKYPGDDNNSKVFIIVNSKVVPYSEIDPFLGWNWMTVADFPVNTTAQVIAPIPLKYLDFEMLYERGKQAYDDGPEFVFEPTISQPGTYSEDSETISGHFDDRTYNSTLEFTMLAGTLFDENTQSRTFPIEVLTAYGEDINGNIPEFVFINGAIIFDDTNPYGKTGAYLAREMNHTTATTIQAKDNPLSNAGWINEEVQRALIRMYNIGKASADVAIYTENNAVLKTEGTRNSRFNYVSDKPILRAEG